MLHCVLEDLEEPEESFVLPSSSGLGGSSLATIELATIPGSSLLLLLLLLLASSATGVADACVAACDGWDICG